MKSDGMNNPAIVATTAVSAAKTSARIVKNNWKPIAAVVGFSVIGYFLYQLVKSRDSGFKSDPNKPPATISRQQALILADRIHHAMNGAGTNEQIIYDVLSNLGFNDFVLVDKAFGLRDYSDLAGGNALLGTKEQPLMYWLNAELNSDEIAQLRSVNPDIFFA